VSAIKFLHRKDWDFNLYLLDGKKVITVIFFGQIDYPRSFLLDDSECGFSIEQMAELSGRIRSNYSLYVQREITPPIFQ
jgi:hypothetical protein